MGVNNITTNIPALQARDAIRRTQAALAGSNEKLSTGLRINRAADDPAGLIAALDLSTVLARLEAETRTTQRVDSISTVADAALSEISGQLASARALAVQAANSGALSDAERQALQIEFDSIVQSIDHAAVSAAFLDQPLLTGRLRLSAGGESLELPSFAARDLGTQENDGTFTSLADLTGGGRGSLSGNPAGALAILDAAVETVATARGRIGAFQANTLAPIIATNQIATENLLAARSLIMDTDYAAQSAEQARLEALARAGFAVAIAANSAPGSVLALLEG